MSYEIVGLLHAKFDTQQINEKFRKREFILEHTVTRNEKKIVDFIKFQLTGDRCDLINEVKQGDMLKIFFNIKGRKFERENSTSYFLNLDVWRLESLDIEAIETEPETADLEINDYLPF